MVCIVAGRNEQHLSGFDLVSLICIFFNMSFFCSKMSALIKSSWSEPVCVIAVAKSFRRFSPERIEKRGFWCEACLVVACDIMQIEHLVNFLWCLCFCHQEASYYI